MISVLVGLLIGPVVAGVPATLCERLSSQIGLKPLERGRMGRTTGEWRLEMASFGQHLFGGSATTAISVRPLGDAPTAAEYARLDGACDATKKGALCRIEGPASVMIRTRKGEAKVEAAAGERAEIEVRNTALVCRDPRAITR